MSDQLAAETTTYTTNTKMNIHAINGFRTRNPSDRVTAEARLGTHGHRNQLI
jgi:hypothetical protein